MGNILFECNIDVEKHGIKKNNRDIGYNRSTGQRYPIKSPELKRLENDLLIKFNQCKNPSRAPITQDIIAEFKFFFPKEKYFTKKGLRNKKIGDLSNLYQLVEDCLTNSGVIEDDQLIQGHDGSRRLPGDQYKLSVKLYKYEAQS